MTVSVPTSCIETRLRDGQRMARVGEHHELVVAERHGLQRALGRRERQHAEVDGAVEERRRHVPRRHAAHVDQHLRVGAAEAGDHRQQRVHRRFVGADDDAAAPHFLELADGELGVGGERQQPAGIVLQQAAGFGQRAVARRPVEQTVAELFLEPLDGLADRRLGPVELLGGLGETSLGRDRRENGEVLQLHGAIITTPYRIPKVINWTKG